MNIVFVLGTEEVMAAVKFSRQREAIKEFLYSRKDHPTAEVVYNNVVKEYPKISLGTVYRNLSFLVDKGEAITVPCSDGSVHFDCNLKPHYHFQCNECGKIADIEMDDADYEKKILDGARKHTDCGEITGHVTFFYGICDECKKKK